MYVSIRTVQRDSRSKHTSTYIYMYQVGLKLIVKWIFN